VNVKNSETASKMDTTCDDGSVNKI